MFKPMAFAISFAMLGSLVFSLTVIPVLCSFFLKGGSEEDTWIMRKVKQTVPAGAPVVARAIGRRRCSARSRRSALSLALVPFLGTEFVPVLEEGSIMFRPTLAPSAGSGRDGAHNSGKLERIIRALPRGAGRRLAERPRRGGRRPGSGQQLDDARHAQAARSSGRPAAIKAELVEAMEQRLAKYPGVALSFTQPIAMRVDELISGVRAQLAITLFGDDLDQLVKIGDQIQDVVARVPGAVDIQTEQVTGQPQLQIRVDRAAISRYGLNVNDVLEAVQTAIGGEEAGQVFEGVRRFDVNLRLQEPYRRDVDEIGGSIIPGPDAARASRSPRSRTCAS